MEALKPYAYQERDIQKIISNNGTGIVATQVGGGKTLIAIEVARRMETATNLVIAPKGTHRRAWERTIVRQIPNAQVSYINSSVQGKKNFASLEAHVPGWYIMSPEFFRQFHWKGVVPNLAIFDEVHRASNRKSKTAKMLHTLKAERKIGLSGTIAGNRIEGMWSVLKWVYPTIATNSFWGWVDKNLDTKVDYFAGKIVVGEKVDGGIVAQIPCYVRHLKRQQCCEFHPEGMDADLPSMISMERVVQLSADQKRLYKKMEKDLFVWLGENPLVTQVPVATRIRLRQMTLGVPSIDPETDEVFFAEDCKSTKLDELYNIIADQTEGEPMLILTHSQKFANVVTKRLQKDGYEAFEWSGKAPQKVRDVALEQFIAGEIQFIVAVIAAIGEGTDGLQERCSTVVWLSRDDNRLLNEQAAGRLDRQGQKFAVVSYDIIAEDTYDEGQLTKLVKDQLAMNISLKGELK
jgi:superfamily II DNA or RNA helicase